MTQIWPGFGDGPVPTVVSMIRSPEAVVTAFPVPWANALAGAKTNDASAMAMAERNEIFACRKCIRLPSLFNAGGCFAPARGPCQRFLLGHGRRAGASEHSLQGAVD